MRIKVKQAIPNITERKKHTIERVLAVPLLENNRAIVLTVLV
jgi:hypothetical protein